jgi:hypothetical protein
VTAAGKLTNHLTQSHPITAVQSADDRLVCGADSAMINADHRLAGNRSDECHRAARGRQNCLSLLGGKINTAMTRSIGNRGRIETALYRRGASKRPASRRW